MGLSRRAYAAHRKERGLTGGSDTAVRKAIAAGRITLDADGTIDPVKADAQWARATDPSKQRGEDAIAQGVEAARATKEGDEQAPVPQAAVSAVEEGAPAVGVDPAEGSHGLTYTRARAAKEAINAQLAKVRLQKLKGELVDRSAATALVFDMARKERDAWMQLPARIAANMAADLGVDAHAMERALDQAIRDQLEELAEIKIDLSAASDEV